MSFISIRAWRTRRNERRAEKLIALAAVSPKDSADAKRVRDNLDKRMADDGFDVPWSQHAGEEGKKHY
jgi:hypothetical protein